MEIKDVRLPQQLMRVMAAEASAMRDARSKVWRKSTYVNSARVTILIPLRCPNGDIFAIFIFISVLYSANFEAIGPASISRVGQNRFRTSNQLFKALGASADNQ